MERERLPIPREHGAYVVLVTSWLIGVIGVNDPIAWLGSLALLFGVLFLEPFFIAIISGRTRFRQRDRIWFGLCVGVGAIGLAISSCCGGRGYLVALPAGLLAVVYSLQLRRHRDVSQRSFTGFLMLTLGAPLVVLSSSKGTLPIAAESYLAAGCFFIGSAFNVRTRFKAADGARASLVYHVIAAAVTAALYFVHVVSAAPLIGVILSSARLLWLMLRPGGYQRISLRQFGIEESVMSGLFFIALLVLRVYSL